jgi:NhaP-type Na+/H+ or K+/H+ antiporter
VVKATNSFIFNLGKAVTIVFVVLLFAMSAATQQASIIAAGTGALAGLVVGLVLTRVVRRP